MRIDLIHSKEHPCKLTDLVIYQHKKINVEYAIFLEENTYAQLLIILMHNKIIVDIIYPNA